VNRLIIFDWDGVIADSCARFYEYYTNTARHFGKDFPVSSLEHFREWYDSAWENNFLKMGFSREELPQAIQYEGSIIDYDAIPLFSGVEDTLKALAGAYELAIASTTHASRIREKLERAGLTRLFRFISGGEEGGSEKTTKIARVLENLGGNAETSIMVGDTVMDIVSSRALGIRNVAVTYGWNTRDRIAAAMPDFIVDHHSALPSLISSVFRGPDA